VYRTNPQSVRVLQAGNEAGAEEITGDMLRDTAENLQRVHEAEGSHIDHVFTRRPHAHKLSMKVGFHSYIICFCILENYEYNVHGTCSVFFLNTARARVRVCGAFWTSVLKNIGG